MQRITVAAIALGLMSITASAQTAATSGATSQSFITNTSPGELRSVPSAIAPGLASSVQACLGSKSAGVSFLGGGFGLGGTHPDRDCNLRLNATLLAQLGHSPAAVQVLCNNRDVRVAMASVGTPCVVDRGQVATTQQAAQPQRRRINRSDIANLPVGTRYSINGVQYVR